MPLESRNWKNIVDSISIYIAQSTIHKFSSHLWWSWIFNGELLKVIEHFGLFVSHHFYLMDVLDPQARQTDIAYVSSLIEGHPIITVDWSRFFNIMTSWEKIKCSVGTNHCEWLEANQVTHTGANSIMVWFTNCSIYCYIHPSIWLLNIHQPPSIVHWAHLDAFLSITSMEIALDRIQLTMVLLFLRYAKPIKPIGNVASFL